MYKSITANLMVESVENSIQFYHDVLGFDVLDKVPNEHGTLDWAIVRKDDVSIMLQERCNLIAEYAILDIERVRPSLSLFIFVDDLYELYESIKDHCQVLKDIKITSYGIHEFAIADPTGYVLTFAQQG